MNVSEVMAKKLVFASPRDTVRQVWKLVFANAVNAVPIVDSARRLVGIVSKEDLLKLLYPDYQEYFEDISTIADFEEMESKVKELGSKKVSDIMCKRVIFTREDSPMMRALSRMIARRLNQLPVLDKNNVVVGMITKGNIFTALFKKTQKIAKKSKK